ncbi:MAG: hypothetical protein H0T44_07990 [Gemmatimonadales bacterium]|nr:hypothetical protein [Gemmatimonadales bacterium]
MPQIPKGLARVVGVLSVAAGIIAPFHTTASAQAAPTLLHWPDPTYEARRQCRGNFSVADLESYLSRVQVARSLPGTGDVVLDRDSRCIRVPVQTVGTGRLVELVLRGVAVPRRAVLLELQSRSRASRT